MDIDANYSVVVHHPFPAARRAGGRTPRSPPKPAFHHGSSVIDTPQIVNTDVQHTAYIHYIIPREEIGRVMGQGLAELMAAVAAQGIAPIGPWFSHHLKMEPETWDFEISVPVARPIAAAGRVQPGIFSAMKVARTIYHGPYEGLPGAWGEFMLWIDANRYRSARNLWECYLTGPESGSDPSLWRTELNRPLVE